jgi:hypothetical protein
MLHLVGPASDLELNDDFFAYIMKNRLKQPSITKPINQLKPAQLVATAEDPAVLPKTSNIPCQYCVLGKCKNWRTDTRFKHILGWYCPLNSEQIALLGELRNDKLIRSNKQKEDETKKQLEQFAKNQQKIEELLKAAIAERPDVAELILNAVKGKEEDDEPKREEPVRKTPVHRIPLSELLKFKDAQLQQDELQ